MAFRTPVSNLKSALSRLGGRSSPFVTSTGPKSKAYAPTLDLSHAQDTKPRRVKGDMVPVFVALGMVVMSTTLGLHTALHQLKRAPNVQVRKSRRETIPELEDPDRVVEEADQFLKNQSSAKLRASRTPSERTASSLTPSEARFSPGNRERRRSSRWVWIRRYTDATSESPALKTSLFFVV